jgi:hypothetical protein
MRHHPSLVQSVIFGLQSISLNRKLCAVQSSAASMSNIAYKRTAEKDCGVFVMLLAAAVLLAR